jgi:hypothetical protein
VIVVGVACIATVEIVVKVSDAAVVVVVVEDLAVAFAAVTSSDVEAVV